ncbi:MAG: hypothetical protein HC922_09315 [Leptolyngbyaceae cyanobacterium SM2_3_12]|nr:hypothetical protein [Leptolyngbyaceae cyanobacterium SM2_3_12]
MPSVFGNQAGGQTPGELAQLRHTVQQLQHQVRGQATIAHSREQVQQLVSQYLGQIQVKLSQIEGVTQSLAEHQRQLTHQWEEAEPVLNDVVTTRKALVYLVQRQRQTDQALAALPSSSALLNFLPAPAPTGSLIFRFHLRA